MNRYQNTKGTFYALFLGTMMAMSTFALVCRAASAEIVKPKGLCEQHVVRTNIVGKRGAHPKRYNMWDSKAGVCSSVYVVKTELPDGRIKETSHIASFGCSPEKRSQHTKPNAFLP